MSENREFVDEFLIESSENLDQLDQDLIALERSPSDPDRLASIFRTVHTIKGNSGFFGFSKLGALTHSGEHLLGQLRDGKITLDDRVTGSLYSMIDAVRSILQSIEADGTEGNQDFRDLAQSLSTAAASAIEEHLSDDSQQSSVPQTAIVQHDVDSSITSESHPVDDTPAEPSPHHKTSTTDDSPSSQINAQTGLSASDHSIRVDVELLASILDMVGELVLARNELRSLETEHVEIQAISHRINNVTNALQETAVKTRLQSIDYLFSKFPRTVRDLSVSLGKHVQLTINGGHTELDRSLIECIRDPLTHLVRNAVDHGLESPAERTASGKEQTGQLCLRAFNESGQVTIEIEDDGRGINVESVRDTALAKGLISAEDASTLSENELLQLIFEPGFSTASTVTNVSGRGVGMDVVKTNIEAIGGTVDLFSTTGKGTRIRVRVPLTLAIMPALVIYCGHERFAIPQSAVRELLPLRSDQTGHRVEGLDDYRVIRVREKLVPIIFLDEFLGIREQTACRQQGTVVLIQVDDYEFGLVIDSLQTGQKMQQKRHLESTALTTIVVKPVGPLLSQIGVYSGATVLGDGSVALILDLRGIRRMTHLPSSEQPSTKDDSLLQINNFSDQYLVCHTNGGRRVAVPLEGVTRLELIPSSELQAVAGHTVVQRGDRFTPVIDVDSVLGGEAECSLTSQHLVIVNTPTGSIGLSVQKIIDVKKAESTLQCDLSAVGVTGSLSLDGMATEVLDLSETSTLLSSAKASL